MKYAIAIIALLAVLLGIGFAMHKQLFAVQAAFILIFAVIVFGAWLLLRLIQKS